MGGYDRLLFKKDEKLPESPKEFWQECKRRMFKGYGTDKNAFKSIWYSENSTFRIFLSDDGDLEDGLWGVLDW